MQFLFRFRINWKTIKCNLKTLAYNANNQRFMSSKIYEQLTIKGLFCSHFPGVADIDEVLTKKQTIYAGFDATNNSLHVGNLLVLISLLHLFQHGHRIIVLVGDATALIGDPAGKMVERQILDDNLVNPNADGIEKDVRQVLENFKNYFAKHKLDDENFKNSSWYKSMNVIDFINRYARQIRMGDMLSKNSIKERLESPAGLSFAEFSYQTFQAYDWYHLFKRYGCRFQVGGTDQMVNIHNGYDMIKKLSQQTSYGLLIPLITDEKGNKIGKSEGKAIFLDQEKTTPFGLYQYFMRLPDADINRFLKLFSFRPMNEIEKSIQNQMKNSKPWRLQRELAEEMTLLVHGQNGLTKARQISEALFSKNLDQIGQFSDIEIQDVFEGIPVIHMEFLPHDTNILDLAIKTGFFESELTAIRTIKEGGFYLNYKREIDPAKVLQGNIHILRNNITITSLGKRNYRLIKWL